MSYPKANFQNGKPQCCAEVYHAHQWRPSRCQRVAVENDAWCAQHSPTNAMKRKMASDEAYKKKWNEELPRTHGRALYQALIDIEAGHNDPRARAKEALDAVRERMR
jgi:hypothetical protein